jgi:hypothetical protein
LKLLFVLWLQPDYYSLLEASERNLKTEKRRRRRPQQLSKPKQKIKNYTPSFNCFENMVNPNCQPPP